MIQFFYVKILSVSIKYESQITQKCLTALQAHSIVSRVFQLGSRNDVTSNLTQIPLCVVVNIEIICSNACRNARILSIKIIFSLMKSGKLVDFFKRKKIGGVSGSLILENKTIAPNKTTDAHLALVMQARFWICKFFCALCIFYKTPCNLLIYTETDNLMTAN